MNDLVIPGGGAINSTDARLIWELVAGVSEAKEVLGRYGMTTADLKRKLKDPMFRSAYHETKQLWASDMNVQQRIRVKAAFLLEDSLLDLFAIVKHESLPVNAKLEAIEKLAKIADVTPGKKDQQTGMAEKFSIQINIGGNDKAVIIDGSAVNALPEAVA